MLVRNKEERGGEQTCANVGIVIPLNMPNLGTQKKRLVAERPITVSARSRTKT